MQKNLRISPLLKRYLAAGAPAFLLDAVLLFALAGLGLNPLFARALSVFCGTAGAYLLHQKYTFASRAGAVTAGGQPVPFAALQIAAGVLDYGVFARVLYSLPHPLDTGGLLLALGLGAIAGACVNYLMLQRLLPATPETDAGEEAAGSYKRNLLWLLMACIAAQMMREHYQAVMQFPKVPYPLGPPDPDVWLYLAQTRQWIEGLSSNFMGGGWTKAFFDHGVDHTNGPFGGITTPWTRPMVMLLSLGYLFTPHGLSTNIRLMLGATWLAPALCLGAVALLARALRAQFNSLHAAGFAGLLMVANPDTYNWYSPGNADHHGFLSTLWCGVLALLMVDSLSAAGALGLGATLGLMIWVSPEGVILTAAVYALLGAEALLRPLRAALAARVFALTATGAALVATLGVFIEMPPGQILRQPLYDTLSITYVTLLWLAAAGASALAFIYRRPLSFGARFFSAAVAGAAVLLAMALLYPRFFLGPFADASSFYLEENLPNIGEAKPLLSVGAGDVIRELMETVLGLALLVFALARRYVRPARLRRLLILLILLLFTTGLTLCRVRWGYYMHPVAIVAVGMSVAGLSSLLRTATGRRFARHLPQVLPRQARPYLALWLAYIVMNVIIFQLHAATPPEDTSPDCLSQVRYVMQSQQLQPLLGSQDLVLFVPADAGGDAQFFTPYRIIGSNFHREGQGLSDLNDIGKAAKASAALPLLRRRQVAALLYCPADYPAESWLRAAADPRKKPSWLTAVENIHIFYPPDGSLPAKNSTPLLFMVRTDEKVAPAGHATYHGRVAQ